MPRFEDLDVDEQRNEILKGIHNHLAQINKWLEVIAARYARLDADDVFGLKTETDYLMTNFREAIFQEPSYVGYTKKRGLYKEYDEGDKRICVPLGEYERTDPIDEDGCFWVKE